MKDVSRGRRTLLIFQALLLLGSDTPDKDLCFDPIVHRIVP